MQRCSIWTVSLAAALSLTGAAWAEHEGGGGHGPAGGHGTTPTFAKQHESDEARESHSGARNSEGHSGANFAARLANNPNLSARLLKIVQNDNLMPSGTTTTQLIAAAQGFRNQGQFLAALHAAKDLNISFNDLKTAMTTGHDSLGQAIQDLKPTDAATLKKELTTARQEAEADLQAAKAAKDKAEDANEGRSAAGANFAARLAARVANDPTLAAQLNSLGVTDVKAAAMGFRNLNQLLTALNVAKDQKLDFGMLQKAIMGGDSLAQAILDQNSKLVVQGANSVITQARKETQTELKTVRAAEDAAEDAKEAANEAAEDAKEAAKEAAEEANEAAKAPTGTTTTGTMTTGSSATGTSTGKP